MTDKRDIYGRLVCLLLGMGIYGLWGTPTPDDPGWPEWLIGTLLVLAARPWRALSALFFRERRQRLWQSASGLLFFYGLSVPMLMGFLGGNTPVLMMRDLLPFLFFLMPLFFIDVTGRNRRYADFYLYAVLCVGFLLAARVVAPVLVGAVSPAKGVDPFYLANAPTVLFAALFLLGGAGTRLYVSLRLGSIVQASVFFALALVPLYAMILVTQRATLGLTAAALLMWMVLAFLRAPRRAIAPALFLAVGLVALWPFLEEALAALMTKTALVGFNMRIQEMVAVMDTLSDSPVTLLFGKGWGATYSSPAVADLTVNFTHSLLTTYWLKTGLVGLLLA
ncbi:MAG: hypothetical protein KDJ15_00315, partial [Alphaproteobacteria bacterium]|nr:hypothetical protein [Alphaproteobacteria bacterium]